MDPPCIMQPRRGQAFLSKQQSVQQRQWKASGGAKHATSSGHFVRTPSTTCGYERDTPRILLPGCSHREQARSPTSASSSHLLLPSAELIVLGAMHRLPSLLRARPAHSETTGSLKKAFKAALTLCLSFCVNALRPLNLVNSPLFVIF